MIGKMRKSTILVYICLVLGHSFVNAQEDETADLYESPFQFTFMFPPLSTNGIKNAKTVNQVSLNLFIGNSGAVDGVELGSFINTDNRYMKGFQAAGFGNMVAGPVTGVQLSGFINVNAGSTGSFQGAGFINVVSGAMDGAQLAGFGNVTGGEAEGAQLAGFFNVAKACNGGCQLAGFTSVNGQGNVNAQFSGFCNVAMDVNGVQAAGFANIAGNVSGVQLTGFINVCDSIDGVPIGFINVVRKNGYRRFEFSLSETHYAKFSYLMGVRKLYNIYTLGKLSGPGSRWSVGAGIGTELDMREKMYINIEAAAYQEIWLADSRSAWPLDMDRLNMLNQARVLFNYEPSGQVRLFAGPTLNVAVSETSPDIGYLPYYEIGPNWAFFNHTSGNAGRTNVRIWAGITGGIRL